MSLNIYFATMTGNAEDLAYRLEDEIKSQGLEASVASVEDVEVEAFEQIEKAVFIVSTWGEGEPPDDAEQFWERLSEVNLELGGLKYAVFGLGDSGYIEFNGFAKAVDARLGALGARAAIPRVDSDVDYDDAFSDWVKSILEVFYRVPQLLKSE